MFNDYGKADPNDERWLQFDEWAWRTGDHARPGWIRPHQVSEPPMQTWKRLLKLNREKAA